MESCVELRHSPTERSRHDAREFERDTHAYFRLGHDLSCTSSATRYPLPRQQARIQSVRETVDSLEPRTDARIFFEVARSRRSRREHQVDRRSNPTTRLLRDFIPHTIDLRASWARFVSPHF